MHFEGENSGLGDFCPCLLWMPTVLPSDCPVACVGVWLWPASPHGLGIPTWMPTLSPSPSVDCLVPPNPPSQADIQPARQQMPPEPQLQTPEMPRASRNPSGHDQPNMKVTVGARTPALQCLHRLSVSFPSLPTKEESLVTS